jgi:hypothetical protein
VITEKKSRERVMAEITISYVLRLANEHGCPMSREQALAFLNQQGRAYEMWKQMMQAGEDFIARSLWGADTLLPSDTLAAAYRWPSKGSPALPDFTCMQEPSRNQQPAPPGPRDQASAVATATRVPSRTCLGDGSSGAGSHVVQPPGHARSGEMQPRLGTLKQPGRAITSGCDEDYSVGTVGGTDWCGQHPSVVGI